jgi:tetratricopeptide (TPR) repeat protein
MATLPTDISAILVSRLDRLNREVREVVQTASVLGREFELRLLSQMLHNDRTLPEKVHHAVEADIFAILTEIRYIFRHALFREAAYNMQLQARKQALHRIAVEAFETLYHDQLAPHYFEIAYHADHAGLVDKAKRFYILAGADAAQAYKNSLAIESYTLALALSSIENIQERIELLLARVALYRILGDRGGQEQDLATLELLADEQGNDRNRAIVALRQADFAFDMGEFQEVLRFAESAIQIGESAHAPDVVANAYITLPLALARQGQIEQAIHFAQTGLRLTRTVGDRKSEGQLFNELGLILLEQKETDRARAYFEKSLAIAQQIGNRRTEAQVLNNIGTISGMFENDYVAARRYFEKTLEIVREIGNRIGEGFALGNLGWAASMQGDFERAHSYYTERLTVARGSGNRYQEVHVLLNLGAMMIAQENYSEAVDFEELALNIAHKLGDRSAEAWAATFLGYANLGVGTPNIAVNWFQTALDIRYSLNQTTLALEPLAGLAQVELDKNKPAAALVYVENILSHLADGGNLEGTEEPLRIYLIVYQTLVANHDPRASQVLKDAYSLLSKQVGKIQGQAHKEMFIQNVPWRREIEELWQQIQASKKQVG